MINVIDEIGIHVYELQFMSCNLFRCFQRSAFDHGAGKYDEAFELGTAGLNGAEELAAVVVQNVEGEREVLYFCQADEESVAS